MTSRRTKTAVPLVVGGERRHLPKTKPEFPEYPYGDAQWYKQSNKGLYGGQTIQTGNQVSEFRNKSRRTWLPNVNRHQLWSEALQRDINIKTTSRVLRTITKEGGVDRYLTKDKATRIKQLGPTGWKLRYRVLSKLEQQEKTRPKVLERVGEDGVPVYAEFTTSGGDKLRIGCGKRKVLAALFGELQAREDKTASSYRKFVATYKSEEVDKLLSLLEGTGYDLRQLAVQAN